MSWERVAIGIAAVAAVVVLMMLLWPVARHRLIYPGGTLSPDRSAPSTHGLPHGQEVWLEAEDGVRIHAWWVPAREVGPISDRGRQPGFGADAARDPDGRGAVVYFHGNAETMATRAWIADRLTRLSYHALLFDYRGYGLSEGRASEEGLALDARAAWRHVVQARDIPAGRVILMGHSLGSAVATRLALELQDHDEPPRGPRTAARGSRRGPGPAPPGSPPAGLVVGAPFPDMPALFHHHAPWLPDRALRWRSERLAAGARLGEVRAPVLVVIGSEDDVIPPEMSRAVYEAADEAGAGGPGAAPSPRLVTVPADHATMMGHAAVWDALERFLGRTLPGD